MSKLLVALVAASFATVAGAQAGATKQEKQSTVSETTKAAVAAENPVGSPKVDKTQPKQPRPDLRDPANQKALQKAATQ